MSQVLNMAEIAAVRAVEEKVQNLLIVSRLQTLFADEKLETRNKQAAAKHLAALQLFLSANRVKNP